MFGSIQSFHNGNTLTSPHSLHITPHPLYPLVPPKGPLTRQREDTEVARNRARHDPTEPSRTRLTTTPQPHALDFCLLIDGLFGRWLGHACGKRSVSDAREETRRRRADVRFMLFMAIGCSWTMGIVGAGCCSMVGCCAYVLTILWD